MRTGRTQGRRIPADVNCMPISVHLSHMDGGSRNDWIPVIAGVIAMAVFAVVTINIYHFVPIISPFVGGLVTGLMVRRDAMSGGRAGAFAGLAGGIIILLDFVLGTKVLESMTSPVAVLAGGFLVIVLIPYYVILAFIGGVIGGMTVPRTKTAHR